jgi:protein-tyrosine phosphatase
MRESAPGAVDVHCHLLPGIDDGSPDWETTLAMARLAVADGITAIVATPHWPLEGRTPGPLVRELAAETQERLRAAEIPLRVFPGHELEITTGLAEALAAGDALTLADSRFILLETPYFDLPVFLRDLVFRLQSQRFRPILAHPERNPRVQRDVTCLEDIVAAGCLLQINAGSVLGLFGPRPRRAAEALLARDWVQLLASDAHGAAQRPPLLAEATSAAARLVGPAAAGALVGATPFAIVQDLTPPPMPAAQPAGWLPGLVSRLRGRQ